MRKSLLALLVAVTPSLAQVHDEVALTRQEIQTERQAIVAENLQLSDAEGKTFWPMYRDYRNEMARNGDRTVKLIHDYAASYDTMTDEQATALLDEALAIQKDELRIKSTWV
ncbi:MAG TPA: hypothetical protein VMR65_10925, partial [Candidatus Sulfotelmatobacter sp.]|nr:hypothetical protein [Candidatus Sulfotelmatobacter sp.]